MFNPAGTLTLSNRGNSCITTKILQQPYSPKQINQKGNKGKKHSPKVSKKRETDEPPLCYNPGSGEATSRTQNKFTK